MDKKRLLGYVAVGVLVLVFSACAQVSHEASLSASPVMAAEAGGGVAILGIDFDPPLEHLRELPPQGIAVLVAVENRGTEPRRQLRVRATLYTGAGQVAASHEGVIDEVPPRGVRVYAFPRVRRLPLRSFYRLVVEVRDAAGLRVLDRAEYTVTLAGRAAP